MQLCWALTHKEGSWLFDWFASAESTLKRHKVNQWSINKCFLSFKARTPGNRLARYEESIHDPTIKSEILKCEFEGEAQRFWRILYGKSNDWLLIFRNIHSVSLLVGYFSSFVAFSEVLIFSRASRAAVDIVEGLKNHFFQSKKASQIFIL